MKFAGAVPFVVCDEEVGRRARRVADRPVGAPPSIFTTSGAITGMLPLTPPVYSVDMSEPLSATHSGLVPITASPTG